MSFPNPTPLRLGQSGTFAGRRYRIAGRLGLATEDGGETSRWTEFHLVPESGEPATLVWEPGERGVQWRLFTYFEPKIRLSPGEMARRKVGDEINLTGTPARVTYVGESRVEFIEGTPPEGVDLGDLARYFNAEAKGEMLVVSWTGDEIECFRGMDLPARAVFSGFGLNELPAPPVEDLFERKGRNGARIGFWIIALLLPALLVVALVRGCQPDSIPGSDRRPATPSPAAASPLAIGAAGLLTDRPWRVEAQRVVEVARMNQRFERNEYLLRDSASDERRWLVAGLRPGSPIWFLFSALPPDAVSALGPFQAAAKGLGDSVAVGPVSAQVTDLSRSTVRRSQPADVWPGEEAGAVRFAFEAGTATNLLRVDWNQTSSRAWVGLPIPARTVLAAFPTK